MRKNAAAYSRRAKELGIELNLGYVCATSIINIDKFDQHWSDAFRGQFKTRPSEWCQVDRSGQPLASWYGGNNSPACMNNPDWRAYERAMVRHQLDTGHDGIFFDNPTVHPQGCYCPHCMKAFAGYLDGHATTAAPQRIEDTEAIRKLADSHREEFLQFRSTTARDFMTDIRAYARTINPRALITCNNSLNSPGVFYSQCRMYGYNIDEMSKVEDLVVVEDMNVQPRTESNGQTVEYGPMYKLLHGINHGKPVVAVTIAGGDYHTPPNLMRLAMAEAASHDASYLAWPTWPEEQRQRMIAAVRPQADFLRQNEKLLNDAPIRADVALYSPFHRWLKTDECGTIAVAAELTKANIQYDVIPGSELASFAARDNRPLLVVESRSVLDESERATISQLKNGAEVLFADQADWLQQLKQRVPNPSITVNGSPNIRAIVREQGKRTLVHVYNLNVQRLSSFEDKVTPATGVELLVRAKTPVGQIRLLTADKQGSSGTLAFRAMPNVPQRPNRETVIAVRIPHLEVSGLLVLEP